MWKRLILLIVLHAVPLTACASEISKVKIGASCNRLGEINKQGKSTFECRNSALNQLKYFDITKKSSEITNPGTPLPYSECQIKDARTKFIQKNESIAFPADSHNPAINSHSRITVGLVPVDFGDFRGKTNSRIRTDSIIKESEEWARWYTRGKLSFNWVVYPGWLRASSKAADFNWVHPASSIGGPAFDDQNRVGANLVKLADQNMDVSGINLFYFLYPDGIKVITDSINFASPIQTSKGTLDLGVYADSYWSQRTKTSAAMWLMHENMHRFGYMGHAPAAPQLFSIAHNQSGASKVMNIWDRLVLDWLNPEDLYCQDLAQLTKVTLTLVPQEREQRGFQGLAIRLTDYSLLILESHRRDKWSPDYRPGFSGITAMIVDTRNDTDRRGEFSDDDGTGTKYLRTANYKKFTQLNHGEYAGEIINAPPWSLNYLIFHGETVTVNGIKISFIKSDYNDTLTISRV